MKILIIPLAAVLMTCSLSAGKGVNIKADEVIFIRTDIEINEELPLNKALDIANYEGEKIQALYVENKPGYTEEDLEILTRVITGEAHTYSDEHQLAVGSVVLNRVKSDKFPNTIKEVVFQKGQYACTKDGNYYREPTKRNIENAKYLLENGSVLPENCVYQAEFKQGSGVYKKIGRTYICYE